VRVAGPVATIGVEGAVREPLASGPLTTVGLGIVVGFPIAGRLPTTVEPLSTTGALSVLGAMSAAVGAGAEVVGLALKCLQEHCRRGGGNT
jgi:hypothetical protein